MMAHGMQSIDGHSQIYKLPISDTSETSFPARKSLPNPKKPSWAKGSNARFNFTVHAYVTPDLEAAADMEMKRISEEHAKGHVKDTHVHKDGCCGSDGKNSREDKLKERTSVIESMIDQLKGAAPAKKSTQPAAAKTEPPSDAPPTKSTANQRPLRKKIGSSMDTNAPGVPYFELRIGLGFSVPMLEKCIKTMMPGDRARFLCMPEECDGYAQLEGLLRQEQENRQLIARGLPPIRTSGCCANGALTNPSALATQRDLLILSGAPLELEIDFIDVLEPGGFMKEVWEMNAVEKYEEAPRRRTEGTELHRRGDYEGACEKYARALMLLESLSLSPAVTDMQRQMTKDREALDREVKRRVGERKRFERAGRSVPDEFSVEAVDAYVKETESRLKGEDFGSNQGIDPKFVVESMHAVRLNYAACKLKLREFSTVIIQCTEVLKHDPGSVKALFRRAQAYRKVGRDLDLAQADLNTLRDQFVKRGVDEMQPEFVELKKEEKELEVKLREARAKEKKMFSNMFA
ncbi:hypothetical protein CcCBS67573_g05781 [Chytriomyces confervae]|uniref:PPIase FKBP-type domain-containing protein n=1 Tax=Chytriomyces confervae TaxID=246404 RepID=A0A507F8U0_9FUNG|nr:hypothetical protein CcCBS67573_g05781 [Chytriomyces confervae]